MLAIVLALLLGVAPQGGTVHTADGGRLRGTVLDAGAGGVTVQLADGSTRKLDSAQVSRVEFADGTSWKPSAPVAAPAAIAPKPSPLQIPIEKLDTVYPARGGRVRGLVTEEGPDGVVVRLVDGAERRYAPGLVSRIDWADGTRSDLSVLPGACDAVGGAGAPTGSSPPCGRAMPPSEGSDQAPLPTPAVNPVPPPTKARVLRPLLPSSK